MTPVRRALVVSGGGAKIPFEIGAIEALARTYLGKRDGVVDPNASLPWDIQAGVSAGALVVAGLSGGRWRDLVKLRTKVLAIRGNRDVFRHRPFGILRLLLKTGGSLFDPSPLRRLIADTVNLDEVRAPGAPLTIVGFVDMVSGSYTTAKATDADFLDAVLASASMPGFFPGISGENSRHLDGGMRNISPLADVIKAGATHVDVVLASPLRMAPWTSDWDSVLGRLHRAMSILMHEVFLNDLKILDLRNERAHPSDRLINVRVVAPEREWSKGALDFDRRTMLAAYQDGMVLGMDPWPLGKALEHYRVDA